MFVVRLRPVVLLLCLCTSRVMRRVTCGRVSTRSRVALLSHLATLSRVGKLPRVVPLSRVVVFSFVGTLSRAALFLFLFAFILLLLNVIVHKFSVVLRQVSQGVCKYEDRFWAWLPERLRFPKLILYWI